MYVCVFHQTKIAVLPSSCTCTTALASSCLLAYQAVLSVWSVGVGGIHCSSRLLCSSLIIFAPLHYFPSELSIHFKQLGLAFYNTNFILGGIHTQVNSGWSGLEGYWLLYHLPYVTKYISLYQYWGYGLPGGISSSLVRVIRKSVKVKWIGDPLRSLITTCKFF